VDTSEGSLPELFTKLVPYRAYATTAKVGTRSLVYWEIIFSVIPIYLKTGHREEPKSTNRASMPYDVAISINYLGCTKGKLPRRHKPTSTTKLLAITGFYGSASLLPVFYCNK
jgi:hypothetical protein